jgi:hypothetical protein
MSEEPKHEGLPVAGYRPQSNDNVQMVNFNKQMEENILRCMDAMRGDEAIDQRWLALGRTYIEQGFMAWNRAIFRPARVKLATDPA